MTNLTDHAYSFTTMGPGLNVIIPVVIVIVLVLVIWMARKK
jgi:hypothetical protein